MSSSPKIVSTLPAVFSDISSFHLTYFIRRATHAAMLAAQPVSPSGSDTPGAPVPNTEHKMQSVSIAS